MNIALVAQELYQKGIVYSDEAKYELTVLQSALTEIVAMTMDAFIRDDLKLAVKVEPLEHVIDALCDELKLHHVARLRKGICTLEQGFTFHDLLTNYERISDHCSNIALALIELETENFNTHEHLRNIEEEKEALFSRYVDKFLRKYTLQSYTGSKPPKKNPR